MSTLNIDTNDDEGVLRAARNMINELLGEKIHVTLDGEKIPIIKNGSITVEKSVAWNVFERLASCEIPEGMR